MARKVITGTRDELLRRFEVNPVDGTIVAGEFYGEKIFVPYFWERSKEKSGVRTLLHEGYSWQMMRVHKAEREEFPELANIENVGVCRQAGAICSWVQTWMYSKSR